LNIRFLPTMPLEFARPSGKRADSDSNNSRGVSAPFALSTTAFARCDCIVPSSSQYSTSFARPLASVSMRATVQPVRSSQLPLASASGIIVTSVDDFADTSQPKPLQKPQWMHGGRLLCACDRIATGAGYGFSPSALPARSSSTPDAFTGIGAQG
jgi:hypothetical protein